MIFIQYQCKFSLTISMNSNKFTKYFHIQTVHDKNITFFSPVIFIEYVLDSRIKHYAQNIS